MLFPPKPLQRGRFPRIYVPLWRGLGGGKTLGKFIFEPLHSFKLVLKFKFNKSC